MQIFLEKTSSGILITFYFINFNYLYLTWDIFMHPGNNDVFLKILKSKMQAINILLDNYVIERFYGIRIPQFYTIYDWPLTHHNYDFLYSIIVWYLIILVILKELNLIL